MRIKQRILRLVVIVREVSRWSFRRLPLGFTVPLTIITLLYFVVLYPVLVYNVPKILAIPANWAHDVFEFRSLSEMGPVGSWAAPIYDHLLHIAAALLTLAVAVAGVVIGHALASVCYHRWRRFVHWWNRPVVPPTIAPRNVTSSSNGSRAVKAHNPNPLDRFERIGIILAGGGAKGAYQAGAMKAIYEFIEDCGARDKVKMIAGTSIGSWNALFWLADMVKDDVDLLGHRVPGALEKWWRGVRISELIKPVTYLPTRQNFLLSNEPWQENFDRLFGIDTEGGQRILEHINHPDKDWTINFYFTCTNIAQARLEVTTNGNIRVQHPNPFLGGTNKLQNLNATIARNSDDLRFGVFSSMDLPPLFPYATAPNGTGAHFYEDGGVIDNLPIYFGTEVEECDLLFVLPLNASFEEEVNHRSLIKRLARVTSIRQGVLERKAFKDVYLFNEMANLRELAHDQAAMLKKVLAYFQNNRAVNPDVEEILAQIEKVLVPPAADDLSAEDLTPLQRALRRKHKPVEIFSVCPAPKLKINTAQFWKAEEAGVAFDLMYKATKLGLEHEFQSTIERNFITMWTIPHHGAPQPFTDF